MASFLEIVFPENVSYGARGGAGWSTRVVVTDSGREYRQQLWDRTRGRWTVGHNLRSQTDWDGLLTFHRLAAGKTFGFRFKDWTDYTDLGRGQLVFNTKGDIQLAKYYTSTPVAGGASPITNYRLISKPRPAGTYQGYTAPGIAFFFNGNPAPGLNVDYTTGLVTGTFGVIAGYTWTGTFDVPVRFDTDEPELSVDLPTAVGWRGIPIIEIRVDDV